MSKLIIAEKPSVAKSIASALGASSRADGFYEGSGLIVSWCVGHLVSPLDAGGYDERFKKWRYEDLPILPEPFRYAPIPGKEAALDNVKRLMAREDVTEIVNACDAGREGELIFRLVYEMAGCRKPVLRLWISSMEDSAIREGFSELRPGADYEALYQSALCRQRADWLVGINATRLFSVLYHRTLNVGRVQTPTLSLLAARDAKIALFQKEKYHHVRLTLAGAENFEDWRNMLDVQGVDVTVRGQHFTFTMKDTGFKIRDTKLGSAYDMTNIMAGLQSTPVIPITFNRRLVAKQTRKTVTVWLPGTHRKKKITFDAKRLVDDGGSTLRAFLPLHRDQIILDPSNRYAGKTTTHGLYQWFGEPASRLEPLAAPERLPLRYGVSPTQQRYYQAQARRLDRLAGEAKALNAAIRWTRLAGGDSAKGLKLLRGKVRESHDELQAAVIALHDAIQQGDLDLVAETRGEMERREALCDRYEGELAAIEREIHTTRDREQTETEQREQHQHKRGRSI